MASITERGPLQFQVVIRRVGYATQTRTFLTLKEAESWACSEEASMAGGSHVDQRELKKITLGELLARYQQEVTPAKAGRVPELSRLKRLMSHPLASRRLSTLLPKNFSEYRDERSGEVKPKTVLEELRLFSAVFNTAKNDWSIPVDNFVTSIRKPLVANGRERRLSKAEEESLLRAARSSRNAQMECVTVLAIETGMRRGEIAGMNWSDVDFATSVVRLSMAKNGDRRNVPLSLSAQEALEELPRDGDGDGRFFSFHDSNGIGAAFARTCARAGIKGLRFHDLRHEAASRLAPRVTAPVLAKIMEWKTIQMAMRYYNPTDLELVGLVRASL